MGIFWTSDTEQKEKEIREAINSINMIFRKMDQINDLSSVRTKEQICQDIVACFAEIDPFMQTINSIWKQNEGKYSNTKVLTPDGRYVPLGLWMTNFLIITDKFTQQLKQQLNTY